MMPCRHLFPVLALAVLAPEAAAQAPACCLDQGLRIAREYRAPGLESRRFTQETLWQALGPALESPVLQVTEIGKSVQGRPLRAITFGRGPTRVLLWSQMHGDESTATMALADIIRWMAVPDRDSLRALVEQSFTITMVPMLNPDGAERFQRTSALGVDINRDARVLATPEGRALKSLRDRLKADIGFNLHDQDALNRSGADGKQVAISLLAPAFSAAGSYNATRERARTMAAAIARVLQPVLEGRLARYDDTFNPRAFGDLMQRWGTSTVLIESGALPGDPEKQQLRAVNVAAILSALYQLTPMGEAPSPGSYERLPFNTDIDFDILLSGGTVVTPTGAFRLDLGLRYDDPLRQQGLRLTEVGDLSAAAALDTIDATGRFVHPASSMFATADDRQWLVRRGPASLTIRQGRESDSRAVGTLPAPAEDSP